MRFIGLIILAAGLLVPHPVYAEMSAANEVLMGRRNPYLPLITSPRASSVPSVGGEPADVATPAKAPSSVLDRLEFVGIAYDEAEAIAAVSDGERTWFVRMGDRLEGAAVTAITPHKLTWNRKGRSIVKHLRREGVR